MRYVALVTLVCIALTACGGGSIGQPGIARPAALSCTPAPVPPPHVMLLGEDPSSLTLATWGYVTAIAISPSVGGVSTIANITTLGTPRPDGSQAFTATLPGVIASKTTYAVTANVTVAFDNCPEYFYNLPVGTFTTP